MRSALLEAALKLPPEERRALIDELAQSLDDGALSPEQTIEIARRTARLERTGPIGEEWETVKRRLLSGRDA